MLIKFFKGNRGSSCVWKSPRDSCKYFTRSSCSVSNSAGHPKWLTGYYGKYLKLPKKPLRRYLYGSKQTTFYISIDGKSDRFIITHDKNVWNLLKYQPKTSKKHNDAEPKKKLGFTVHALLCYKVATTRFI